jgi:cysteine-rich repeat protein
MDSVRIAFWIALVCSGCIDAGSHSAGVEEPLTPCADGCGDSGADTRLTDASVPSAEGCGDAVPAEEEAASRCGDGIVAADEECDPESQVWSERCDETCKRTEYKPCVQSDECVGPNDNCAGYATASGRSFCAPFCVDDASCPVLPGFASACNFAWCAVLCDSEGECPNGMSCQRAVEFIDRAGSRTGARDVCILAM